jgi:hypothetical protein
MEGEMRDSFHWERNTENFHVFVSDRKMADGHVVIYLPKVLGTHQLPKQMDCIVTKREHGIQCCSQDNDYDGNCAIHSAPGVLRPRPAFRGGFTSRVQYEYDPPLSEPPRHALQSELRELRAEMYGVRKEIFRRIERTEHRVNILFKAVDKMLRLLGWVK